MPTVGARVISERYFETMGIPLLQGRAFTPHDDADAPSVVIVNRTMARRFWPGRNPVGQRIAFPAAGGAPAWNEVVGVAGDVSHDGIGAAPIAELYLPYLQNPDNGGALVVRTSVNDPLLLTPALRRAAASVDPDQAFIDLRTMRETATQSVAMQRFSMLLLGAFSAFATLLTALGLYGTLAHAVGRRTRELGVRIALGATPRSIARLVAGRAALLLSLGVVLGTLAALLGARLIASQLYGVAPRDPATLAAAVLLLVSVAAVATAVPVGRAVRIEPVEALRDE
jgi:putative ABC transport system permease protein